MTSRRLLRIEDGVRRSTTDQVVAEEPLEIRVGGESLTVTMRTPENDFELAAGFLVGEGIVERADDIRRIRYCVADGQPQHFNVLNVDLAPGVAPPVPRNFLTSSSCGVCGKASIDEVRVRKNYDVADDPLVVPASLLATLPKRLAESQRVFRSTGGLHAGGLFDATGELRCVREDVGRHNAFDKVIGWAALARQLPLRSHVIMASGRASFELTQKALAAGIPMVAAVSAPSSLAVELAEASGMTLVGFLRGSSMNVYTGAHRVG